MSQIKNIKRIILTLFKAAKREAWTDSMQMVSGVPSPLFVSRKDLFTSFSNSMIQMNILVPPDHHSLCPSVFTAYYKKDPKIQDAHAESLVSTEQEE